MRRLESVSNGVERPFLSKTPKTHLNSHPNSSFPAQSETEMRRDPVDTLACNEQKNPPTRELGGRFRTPFHFA